MQEMLEKYTTCFQNYFVESFNHPLIKLSSTYRLLPSAQKNVPFFWEECYSSQYTSNDGTTKVLPTAAYSTLGDATGAGAVQQCTSVHHRSVQCTAQCTQESVHCLARHSVVAELRKVLFQTEESPLLPSFRRTSQWFQITKIHQEQIHFLFVIRMISRFYFQCKNFQNIRFL